MKNKQRECVENGECRPSHRSQKDTRLWCKGHVGREHRWKWINEADASNHYLIFRESAVLHELVICAVCSRMPSVTRRRCGHCGEILAEYGKPPAYMRGKITDTLMKRRHEEPVGDLRVLPAIAEPVAE